VSTVRVAAHVHSSWSYDGEWSLDAIARAFDRLGYDVVLMAEHDRGFDQRRWSEYQAACSEHSTSGTLLVPGIEYSDGDNLVHMLVWGDELPFLGEGRDTFETLQAARTHGAVTVLAHPWRRRGFAYVRPESWSLLSGIEIWNRKYDGIAPRAEAQALAELHGVAPFVALDFHCARQFFPLALAIDVPGPPVASGVVQALRDRAFDLRFLGAPTPRFTGGSGGRLLQSLERLRRGVRPPVGQAAR
jgi:hypothetical protein